MAPKRIEITLEMFNQYKKKYLHHWTYLNEWKQVSRTVKTTHCRCELCGSKHWVMWRSLVEGTSTRCKSCARKLTGIEIEDFNNKLKREGSLYKITGETKSDGSGRRKYWVICKGCDTGHWVTIDSIHKAKSCMSCAQSWWQRGARPTPKPKPEPEITSDFLPIGIGKVI